RLFIEEEGHKYLKKMGVSEEIVSKLHLLGISSIANLLMAIKFAKYYELTQKDVILTVFTDSMELYQSRIKEYRTKFGSYSEEDAIKDFHSHLMGQKLDNMLELNYVQRKRIHNLKYFTWIEQQGRDLGELIKQWDDLEYWKDIQKSIEPIDNLIIEFNEKVNQG
ncbi:MAG: pyridoxal-5-phosphate-dependent protein subunit beta, partial [Candidatus Thorarchaeota archaeon]